MNNDAAVWVCVSCGASRQKPEKRLPSGWKRRDSDIYCSECWRKAYLLRAITIPVAEPLDCDWKTLDAALKQMWRITTQASNWIMTELFARDARRTGDEKMPAMSRVYLYPELRQRWPDLPPSTVASLEHALQAKYRSMRYEVLWTCSKSLPSFRYPVPCPVPAQAWSITIEKDTPILSFRLGGQRLRVRLKGGPRFRRQSRALMQMVSGEAVTAEAAIYRSGDDLLVKLVAWLPRQVGIRERSGSLRVRTANDSLLVAVNDKDDVLWRYNADHLRRWIAEHRRVLQRWSEDQKYEQRPVPSFVDRRASAAEKYHNRLQSACHEISMQLANYADRRRFASVLYDDSERGFVPQFPYFRLSEMIQQKLDAKGIEFALASAEVQAEKAAALARG